MSIVKSNKKNQKRKELTYVERGKEKNCSDKILSPYSSLVHLRALIRVICCSFIGKINEKHK